MKIVILQDDLFGYLQHIIRSYAGGGIDPDEGLALYHLSQAIKGAQVVDDEHLAKIKTSEVGNTPIAQVEVQRTEPASNV